MRYQRAVFAAGLAVGFMAGAWAGRERYDQIVGCAKKAAQSPPVHRATSAVSAKAGELSAAAAAKTAGLAKSAAAKAPKAARRAKDRISSASDNDNDNGADGHHGRFGCARSSPDGASAGRPSVNGNSHVTHDYHD